MRRSLVLLATTLAVATLGACGSSGDNKQSDQNRHPSTTTTPTATISQFASYVTRADSGVRSALAATDECGFVANSCPFSARISLSTLGSVTETLAVNLRGASSKAAGQYVGAPPAEIEDLVTETISNSENASEAAKAASDCLLANNGSWGSCPSEFGTLDRSKFQLKSTLDAWKPYL